MSIDIESYEQAAEIVEGILACESGEAVCQWLTDQGYDPLITDETEPSVMLSPSLPVTLHIKTTPEAVEFSARVRLYKPIHDQSEAIDFVKSMANVFCDELGLDKWAYREVMTGYTVEADSILYDMKYTGEELVENKQI